MTRFRILVDEDLHRDIASLLQSQNHDVAFTPKNTKNGTVYKAAVSTRRLLLTGDNDFLNTSMYPPKNTKGIIVVKIHPPYLVHVIPVLTKALRELSAKKLKGKLIVLEPSGFWIKR